MKLPDLGVSGGVVMLGLLAAGGVGLWVWSRGGLAKASVEAGGAIMGGVIDFTQGAAETVLVEVAETGSEVAGIPTPSQTLTDPAHVRWVIDHHGTFTATLWGSAGALFTAIGMDEGTGTQPPANSPAFKALGPGKAPASYSTTADGYTPWLAM